MTSEYPKILSLLEKRSQTGSYIFTLQQKCLLWKARENILKILADRGITDTSPNGSVTFEEFIDWIGEDTEFDIMNYMTMTVKKNVVRKKVEIEEKTMVMWISKAGVPELESIASMAKLSDITNVLVVVCHSDVKHPAKTFVAGASKLHVHFQLYTLSELQYDVSTHRLVPKHEFATKQEIKAIKREYKVTKSQIPRIKADDVQVRHLAAQPGDVLKIKRPSETLPGYFDIYFRVVVP